MKRNSNTLFLESPGATTPVPWVNNAPDFSGFTEPTLSVLQRSWSAFLESGQELEVIPDPPPPPPAPDWAVFRTTIIPPVGISSFENWIAQAKDSYQAAIVTAAMTADAVELQQLYTLLKTTLPVPPTVEEITEWQSIADTNHIPVQF